MFLLNSLCVCLLFLASCSPYVFLPEGGLYIGSSAPAPLPPLLVTTPHTELWMANPGVGGKTVRLAKTGSRLPLEVRDPVVRGGYVFVRLHGGIEVEGYARVQDLETRPVIPRSAITHRVDSSY